MKKIVLLTLGVLCFSINSIAQGGIPDFGMMWFFTEADGSNITTHENVCRCGTVYVKNRAVTDGDPIGAALTTGVYRVTKEFSGEFVADIDPSDWAYDEVYAIDIPCNLSFGGSAKNFRITHYGPGIASVEGFRHRTNYLNTHAIPSVDAGPDQTICFGENVVLNGSVSPGSTYIWEPGSLTDIDPTVMPSSTTTYTLSVSKTYNGWNQNQTVCTNSDDVEITVEYGPELNLFDRLICSDDNLPIISAGIPPGPGFSFEWKYDDGGVFLVDAGINPTVNTALYGLGTYTVTVTGPNGCKTKGNVTVSLDPSATISPNFSHVINCSGFGLCTIDMTSPLAGSQYTHFWSINNSNAAGDNLGPVEMTIGEPNTYTSSPLDGSQFYLLYHSVKSRPCDEWKMKQVHILPSGGNPNKSNSTQPDRILTDEEITNFFSNLEMSGNLESNFQVYPNPNTGTFTVETDFLAEQTHSQIKNVMGAVVWEGLLINSKTEITLSKLPSGVYFFEILDQGVQKTKRFIIQ